MTTYYHRRHSDGEIVNASESDLPLHVLINRFPLTDCYYDPNPLPAVLERYQYWDERP